MAEITSQPLGEPTASGSDERPLADDRVPRLVPLAAGRVLQSLPLGPVDGFVLSRVDGVLSEKDLVHATGLSDAQISTSLHKLELLSLIAYGPEAPQSPIPSEPSTFTDPNNNRNELDEAIDLELSHRKRILDTYYRLDELDHYALLGVPRDADKKTIKRKYYELAGLFHPDRFFRKELGSFKAKMETVFGRLTQAHDALLSKEAREEYDAYLQDIERTRGLETLFEDMLKEAKRAEENALHDLPLDQERVTQTAPFSQPPRSTSPSPPKPGPSILPSSGSIPPPGDQARRDALARRLMGGGRTTSQPPKPAGSPPPTTQTDAARILRRHYEERMTAARKQQAAKYAAAGAEAIARNDPVAATNSYRVALTFAPGDIALTRALEDAMHAANAVLSETYTRQALYEERCVRWSDAARSWTNLTRVKPEDAQAHERVAHAYLKAEGNLHEAKAFAQKAVLLDPMNASYKITLANVYLAAGLLLNAKREAEAAAQLLPHDATIKQLLRRLSGGA